MAIVESTQSWSVAEQASGVPVVQQHSEKPLHRISTVRRQQGMSLRSVARQLGSDVRTLRSQEEESADLSLSDLYRWQQALDVPVADLLEDPGATLSRPVMERAKMLRLMKTAAAILERAESAPIKRMAQMMVEQLVEIMPELEGVSAWHTVGQRRSLDELGAVAERPVADSLLFERHD